MDSRRHSASDFEAFWAAFCANPYPPPNTTAALASTLQSPLLHPSVCTSLFSSTGPFDLISWWLHDVPHSPCTQHASLLAMHIFFILLLFVYRTANKCCFRRVDSLPYMRLAAGESLRDTLGTRETESLRSRGLVLVRTAGWSYWTAAWSPFLVGSSYLATTIRRLLIGWQGGAHWIGMPVHEVAFAGGQALGFLIMAAAVKHERRRGASFHSRPLRSWWVVNFFAATPLVGLALWRLVNHAGRPGSPLFVDDLVLVLTWPVSVYLGWLGLVGRTGLGVSYIPLDSLSEPLLPEPVLDGCEEEGDLGAKPGPGVSAYSKAGVLSTWTFSWLGPLLERGSEHPLQLEELPQLSTQDGAEASCKRFRFHLERQKVMCPTKRQSAIRALVSAFWAKFASAGILVAVNTAVMYAGPLLLNRFVDYAGGKHDFEGEGFVLVAVLFLAKLIETSTEHQYNFKCQRLGMHIRSSLIAAIYRKGLRLSSQARQKHTVGGIVNYMAVDTQRLADLTLQLHNIWVLPLQIAIALVILFQVVGYSMLAGLGTMTLTMLFNFIIAKMQRAYQVKIMEAKDVRVKATNESLINMKILKLYAWEAKFRSRIEVLRLEEYKWLQRYMYNAAFNVFALWLSPLAVSVLTFATCLLVGTPLTTGRVFTAIATFRILQDPLRAFPQVIQACIQALVSIKRINDFLVTDELQADVVARLPMPIYPAPYPASSHPEALSAIELQEGEFQWKSEEEDRSTLRGINLRILRGQLVAVCGTVGSGKSSLLSCILGEMPKVKGQVTVRGSFAYVAQSPWIQNASIRDNILFGRLLDPQRYEAVLRVCCLEKDLDLMPHGDDTEIGERGINLSGGQKQRIQLARAVYQDADTYLLDDPFSAVDAHTGTQLFTECVAGALATKSVVLVTHQVDFLPAADLILVLKDGEIAEQGRYEDLLKAGTDFGALVKAHEAALHVEAQKTVVEEEAPAAQAARIERPMSPMPVGTKPVPHHSTLLLPKADPPIWLPRKSLERQREQELKRQLAPLKGQKEEAEVKGSTRRKYAKEETRKSKLVKDEERETGRVSPSVYRDYLTKAFGGMHIPVLICVQILWQSLQIASDWWLADATNPGKEGHPPTSSSDPGHFMSVYAALALSSGFFVLIRTLVIALVGLKTTQAFFTSMLQAIFRAPMAFFDTTPSGRILNRTSTDQSTLDMEISFRFGSLLALGFQLIGILAVTSSITPWLLAVVLPMAAVFYRLQGYFLATSRELTRIDSITKSPIIHHFSETLSGSTTIRAFAQEERFAKLNLQKIDSNLRSYFYNFSASEWLGLRLEMLAHSILCGSALLLVSLPVDQLHPGLVGMSLSYGLSLNHCIFYVVVLFCAIENKMVSVERIQQYANVPSEAPAVIEANRPSAEWPSEGYIHLDNLQVRYQPSAPLILHGVSCHISAGEKVGVVGRTGSGKTTLIQALFRLVEPCGGCIVIDGVDISSIGLSDLRSKLSIIPQEPTLFEGTVRSNLDPLGQHTDLEIWEALEKANLGATVRDREKKLEASVAENGENWSVGQRQLFCLGRALLRRCKIIILDEATASVDNATDTVIQKTIRIEFANCTVLSVAHRIPTVIDSDRVLVLEAGRIKEFDRPAKLLDDKDTLFASLVHEHSSRSSSVADLVAMVRTKSNLGLRS